MVEQLNQNPVMNEKLEQAMQRFDAIDSEVFCKNPARHLVTRLIRSCLCWCLWTKNPVFTKMAFTIGCTRSCSTLGSRSISVNMVCLVFRVTQSRFIFYGFSAWWTSKTVCAVARGNVAGCPCGRVHVGHPQRGIDTVWSPLSSHRRSTSSALRELCLGQHLLGLPHLEHNTSINGRTTWMC